MGYPNLPYNRLIVDGVDISMKYRMVMADGYTLEPPEPKTYTIDIPGGDGVIDLTESLSGDVVYNNRRQEFTFYIINMLDHQTFEDVKTQVSNFLHGRAFDYQLTFDPGYIYHGRFSVSEYNHQKFPSGYLGAIKISIDADPYKTRGDQTYVLNAIGGRLFRIQSGRKPVHPTVECSQPITVFFDGKQVEVPAGTWRLNDVLLKSGYNDFYVNSFRVYTLSWADIGQGGKFQMTWDQAKAYRWDSIHLLDPDYDDIPICWENLRGKTWNGLADKTWRELNLEQKDGFDTKVYLQYEWKDL